MPYTPPAHLSPASSRNPSPVVSRNPSWTAEMAARSGQHARPQLPRSTSSTHYLNKHRRSPSTNSPTTAEITRHNTVAATVTMSQTKDAECLPTLSTSPEVSPAKGSSSMGHTSLTAALLSPSAISSSEPSDADDRQPRKLDVERTWNELEQAVRKISIRRSSSPIKKLMTTFTDSEPVTQVTSPSMLSPEARRISHSRSNTETAVVVCPPAFTDHSTGDSGEGESDSENFRKPNLVRKKSGELVKPALRPSSRRRYSSMPGTPTYSKSVKFDESGNQTRHFLQVDKPMAISCDSSPAVEYESDQDYGFGASGSSKMEWAIKLTNFPTQHPDRIARPVWVERIFLSGDNKSLVGQVAVANISFHKMVVARFTLDYWKTTSEVSAEYVDDLRRAPPAPGHDRFSFSIKLADQARLESKTMLLCVRYNVEGAEHWDNNDNTNYQIDFVKKVAQPAASKHMPQSTLGARPLNAIPRSRHHGPSASTSHASRGRSPSIDDDIVSTFDSSSHKFRPSRSDGADLFGDDATAPTLRLKKKSASSANLSPRGSPQKSAGLGGRYDFGASLSAALSTAQDRLGKTSGSKKQTASGDRGQSGSYFSPDAPNPTRPQEDGKRPDSMATDRPAIGSAQYKDLVSKFCYFTPAHATAKLSPQPPSVHDDKSTSKDSPPESKDEDVATPSQESSDTSTEEPSPMLDGVNERFDFGTYATPSAGMTHHTIDSGSASPATYYMYHRRDGYLSDSHTPTAIPG